MPSRTEVEYEVCTHSTWGSYQNPPDHCDNDAEPGTDPPRCSAHVEDFFWGDEDERDHCDD